MTALLGGSFNPIHNGHIGLARWIVANGYAESVWLMVSPQNPLKTSPELADEYLRLRWASIACRDIEGITASDFEYHLPRPSFTWQTLMALRETFPEEQFALTIGADNWLLFHRWARHEWILQHTQLLVYPRQGYEINTNELPQNVTLMPAPLFPYSSTAIREGLRAGTDISSYLPKDVLTDIIRHKAYLQ